MPAVARRAPARTPTKGTAARAAGGEGARALTYLYAIVPAAAASTIGRRRIAGLADAPVRLLVEGEIAGVIAEVPAADFDQESLDRNVRDPQWLGPRATRHQEVNARLLEFADAVLPLAFGTIYRGEQGVRQLLRERTGDLRGRLAAVRGRAEWVVAVRRDADAAAAYVERSDRLKQARQQIAASAPGRGYLLTRKIDEQRRAELRTLDGEAVTAASSALGALSEAAYDEPVVEAGAGLVSRVTHVIRREREPKLRAAVERFNAEWSERGYEMRLTGPWPPYRSGGER